MNKREFDFLSKMFQHEIECRNFPFQSKAKKITEKLIKDRIIEKCVKIDRLLTVEGFQFTDYGHILYCSECDNPDFNS